MLRVIYLLFPLSQILFGVRSAPAGADPTSLSLNAITPNLSSTFHLSSDETINSLAQFFNTPNPEPIVLFRVPDTDTLLRISVQDEEINKSNMGRTILRTQQSLSAFIERYDADDTPVARVDDPYESDARYVGCFFGVATYPAGFPHLTYGVVMNVLQGLWLYLYRGDRFHTAVFEVRDEQFGTVGIGKITPGDSRGSVLGLGEVGAGNASVI